MDQQDGIDMTVENDKKKEMPAYLPNHLLSSEFLGWYEELTDQEASLWNTHPHFILVPHNNRSPNDHDRRTCTIGETNSLELQRKLEPLIDSGLVAYLEHMPPITSADLLQTNEKIMKLMTIDSKEWFVAIEVDEPEKIVENLKALDNLSKKFNERSERESEIGVLQDWAIVSEGSHHFLISPFIGNTLEQAFKADVDPQFRSDVIKTLSEFASFCESEGYFWRDFAPRNILIPNGTEDSLVLIDYENLFLTDDLDSEKRSALEINRRIWFGDIFTQDEIDSMFGRLNMPVSDPDALVDADDLESLVYEKDKVSLQERMSLNLMTAQIEQRHEYKDKPVYGHRIGRYMTDFTSVQNESHLYVAYTNLSNELFKRYLFIIQKCIDVDSRNMLSTSYGLNISRSSNVSDFMESVSQVLEKEEDLIATMDSYEGKLK